jgi:hypothetical protein
MPDPEPPDGATRSTPWIVAMFGWLSDANTRASRSNRARRSGSVVRIDGRILIATSAAERGVARAVDLAL